MPYNVLKVLSHLKFQEYVEHEVSSLKKYVGEPLLFERYDREMFEAWKERGEAIKEAYDNSSSANRTEPNTPPPPDETPQEVLTGRFYTYYNEQIVQKNLVTAFYEACLKRPLRATGKKRKIIDPKKGGSLGYEERTELQRAIDELNNLIDFVEWVIVG